MTLTKGRSYDANLLRKHMMGPNAVKMLDELTQRLNLEPGMRVLDLGCGQGLTSLFLAKEFGVTVFAADLWIDPGDNYRRFREWGFDDKIIPIHAEAHELPFAKGYFDAAISVDAYHYFGAEKGYLERHLAPLVRTDGQVAVAVPGLKRPFPHGVPAELKPYWQWSEHMNIFTEKFWRTLWDRSDAVDKLESGELQCCAEAWSDWLACAGNNEYARRDIPMMEAEGGNWFNLVYLSAIRK